MNTDTYSRIHEICLNETSKNPVIVLRKLMQEPFCPMHGPIHHVLVGSALLTAYRNAGGTIVLSEALQKMTERGSSVPGAVCGLWGACGAGISTGMYLSILTESGPLKTDVWSHPIRLTSKALEKISSVNGPRCCKRDSYFALQEAVRYTEEYLGVKMELDPVTCIDSFRNTQCLQNSCPFHPLNKGE